MNMLQRFRKAQEKSIQLLLELKKNNCFPPPFPQKKVSFVDEIRNSGLGAIIAEYKRASPSRGPINLQATPEEIALLYATNGAAAISVLTEVEHFHGSMEFLDTFSACGLPLLRKDFLLHPIQIEETATSPAAAVLLVIRMLDDATFVAMLQATKKFSLDAVIEVFNKQDLDRARKGIEQAEHSPSIIQVNTRDLDTMHMNNTVLHTLIIEKKPEELWIAASGVHTRKDLEQRVLLGYDAVLVGTSLMEKENPGDALAQLTHAQFYK